MAADGLDPAALFEEGWLSDAVPESSVPGDPSTVAALGYLHANCSHCHNRDRPPRVGDHRWTQTSVAKLGTE